MTHSASRQSAARVFCLHGLLYRLYCPRDHFGFFISSFHSIASFSFFRRYMVICELPFAFLPSLAPSFGYLRLFAFALHRAMSLRPQYRWWPHFAFFSLYYSIPPPLRGKHCQHELLLGRSTGVAPSHPLALFLFSLAWVSLFAHRCPLERLMASATSAWPNSSSPFAPTFILESHHFILLQSSLWSLGAPLKPL